MTNGYHPKCFKEATGVILKKSQSAKPFYRNYALPKAYRVILLFNCLTKVMEKIIARRLAVMAEFKTLLYMHYYYYYYSSISACSPRAGTDNIHICASL
jgi:hypothetical protein